MPIVDIGAFLSVNPSIISDTNTKQAVTNLKSNVELLRAYGIGTAATPFEVERPTASVNPLTRADSGKIKYVGVNSSVSALTMTLPADLDSKNGDSFYIVDETGNASTYNVVIDLTTNSLTANGSGSNITITKNYGYLWIMKFTASSYIILNQDLT